jgi:hypothetical protein
VKDWKQAGLLKPSAMKPVIATIGPCLYHVLRYSGNASVLAPGTLNSILKQAGLKK